MNAYTFGKSQYTRHNSGLFFNAETSEAVRDAVARLYASGARVRVFYGNAKTGKVWNEENDVTGTIGASAGACRIPLLIANRRSAGGSGLLDSSIVAIVDIQTRRFLYRHESFDCGEWSEVAPVSPGYSEAVAHNGELWAQFQKPGRAARFIAFMKGERFTK